MDRFKLVAGAMLVTPSLSAASVPSAGDRDPSAIIVTGRLAATARQVQNKALNLVNVQSAETIAKYPDVNAAEAISRIPGVALSVDTGEGRFVNIMRPKDWAGRSS